MGNKSASRAFTPSPKNAAPTANSSNSGILPSDISNIVGEFLDMHDRYLAEVALAGAHPINLCLSQDVNLRLATCWSLGFLSPERRWKPLEVEIDTKFAIKDHKRCCEFLDLKKVNNYRAITEVLVVQLSETSGRFQSVLDDLRNTIGVLERYLNSVKHMVISITQYASCCFTLQNVNGKGDSTLSSRSRQKALLQVIKDLEKCWTINKKLDARGLFAYYFESDVKPASEMHLAKFVVSLGDSGGLSLFEKVAAHTVSTKIMWIYLLDPYPASPIKQETLCQCHAIYLDAPVTGADELKEVRDRLGHAFCYHDNTVIERIVLNTHLGNRDLELPRPRGPLTDTTLLSALIELTLEGQYNDFSLTDLNNGYFPKLKHLSIKGGRITGKLDSQRVPRLRTFILEPNVQNYRSYSTEGSFVRERCESLTRAGRPWQLVATQDGEGWSLASYDISTSNSNIEAKEESLYSPHHPQPLIQELLLVAASQRNASEWQIQLKGGSPLKPATQNHRDHPLIWAPERVQKITAISMSNMGDVQIKFMKSFPGQTRILSSLTSRACEVLLDGAALPYLQSLEIGHSSMTLSGTFPRLQTLSFYDASLHAPWTVDAPLLQTFHCHELKNGAHLSLNLQLLPHLSSLKIIPISFKIESHPKIMNIDGDLGWSRIQHIVFDRSMTLSFLSKQHQLNCVTHLELSVDVLNLPACWANALWLCETLNLDIYASSQHGSHQHEKPDRVVLPLLPRVKTLTVNEKNCRVLLDREMPELIECTVTSYWSFGPNLKCPKLKRIRFTEGLLTKEKEHCLDRDTYRVLGAQPREVIFATDYQLHTMSWDIAPNENTGLPVVGPLEIEGNLAVIANVFFVFWFFTLSSSTTGHSHRS